MTFRVETLLGQARKVFEHAKEKDKEAVIAEILPNSTQWRESLSPLLETMPSASLAITNQLSCAIKLIRNPSIPSLSTVQRIARDVDGFSSAFRVLSYVIGLLNVIEVFSYCTEEGKVLMCQNILVILQLAGDQIAKPTSNGLWDVTMVDSDSGILGLIADAQSLMASWMRDREQFVITAQQQLLEMCQGRSVLSYYSARAYTTLTTELKELHGNALEEIGTALMGISRSPGVDDLFKNAALLASASESNQLSKLTNELLASLTDHNLKDQSESGKDSYPKSQSVLTPVGIRLLILLNCSMQRQDGIVSAMPQQRLVFFVKHLVSQIQDNSLGGNIRTEIFRVLTIVLPHIKNLYGEFWNGTLSIIRETWLNREDPKDSDIPLINSSLRLLSALRTLATQESNDDLQETWADAESLVSEGLLGLLKHVQGKMSLFVTAISLLTMSGQEYQISWISLG